MREKPMEALEIYEVLVKEHEGMLQAYLLGVVGDSELAEDIAQEAFIQAYRKLATLKKKEAFAAWLRAIARNIAFAELRRRGREIATDPEVIQGMEEVFAVFDSHSKGNRWEERVAVVERCFKALPETLSTVCKLHYFEDHLVKDIANLLRISLSAVLKRLERARNAIRRCVERKLGLEEV
jgi:RNA polymerase sigma-70 factor (ECF subfamily)